MSVTMIVLNCGDLPFHTSFFFTLAFFKVIGSNYFAQRSCRSSVQFICLLHVNKVTSIEVIVTLRC